MSHEQQFALYLIGALTTFWVVSGFLWLALTLGSTPRPNSISELKERANRSNRWYLIPFADKTTKLWKYLSWLFVAAMLLLEFKK